MLIIPNAGEHAEKLDFSYIASVNVKWQSALKIVCQVLKKLSIHLPYNSVIALLGIYPREMRTYVHRKTSTLLFIETLFVIAKNWK